MYVDRLREWYEEHIAKQWPDLRTYAMQILQQESELEEIVKLVGIDALSANDRLTLEAARSIREDYLQQNAFEENDTYTSMQKQYGLLSIILHYYDNAKEALAAGASIGDVTEAAVRVQIGKAKQIPEKDAEAAFAKIAEQIDEELEAMSREAR